ncbi:hypothetical protein [Streptomyces sp. SID13031]|uniref:hypothetical protein n=1 Tax=Streptomyces sp. SID13031 TaxID=2706046 RepID=UPI0013CA6362|nr:hypothetical protein [Streptomyces sp. SID13031]NEA35477.1 hypothetical protein [Streptomyces sp. SID13031]
MKVVLLSTRRQPPSYFETVRADLGGRDDVALDVVAWLPPAAPVDGLVTSFTLIGPGTMPVEVVPPAEPVAAEAISTPKPAAKPRPNGAKRIVKKLAQNRKAGHLAKAYWAKVLGRADVMSMIEQADVVIALDNGSVWAGWQVGQRKPQTPVVLGVPAARRELDRLVGAEQE